MTEVLQNQQGVSESILGKYKQQQAHLQSQLHEHKKSLLEAKTQLQFERNRANEFEEKYKASIRYQNEQKQLKKIMNELDQKLTNKENEMLNLLKLDQEKKRKISDLNAQIQDMQTENSQMTEKMKQISQGAVSAIIEKDTVIAELQEKIQSYIEQQSTNQSLNDTIIQLEEKYKELEQRHEAGILQLESIIEAKEEDIRQNSEKYENTKQKLQERINRLEQEIIQNQKHIQHLNQAKTQGQTLEQRFYIEEQKLRKSQKKNHELQLLLGDVKKQCEDALIKYHTMEQEQKPLHEEIKNLKAKVKQLQKQIKQKEKASEQTKAQHEKVVNELNKKIQNYQSGKKKNTETIELKTLQIDRLRLELEEKTAEIIDIKNQKNQSSDKGGNEVNKSSLASEIQTLKLEQTAESPMKLAKKQSEQTTRIIEKLKQQVKDFEENNTMLSQKLEDQIKQNQEMRQRLVSQSGSASMSDGEQKLLRTVEDLNGHIKKVENSLMINKLKYAEDQSYWSQKQKKYKVQIEANLKQSKKQKSELLERIDRMKKNSVKDKKMDYYQSAFK